VIPVDTPSPPPYGGWVSYGTGEAIVLAIVLAAMAGTFAYLGTRYAARSALGDRDERSAAL
jgi:hypothetical protein